MPQGTVIPLGLIQFYHTTKSKMKYATSLTLGGELVDAEKCNYSSFKDLMLTCPVCRSPVFLRKESQRTIQSKSVQVQPHWCHFQEDKNFPMACENRMKGVSKLAFAQSQSQARGQRLKIFQSKALSIWNEVKKQEQKEIMNALGNWFEPDEWLVNNFLASNTGFIDKVRNILKQVIDNLHQDEEVNINDEDVFTFTTYECIYKEGTSNFDGYIPSNIDRKIGVEYLQFLSSKRQSQLFSEIIAEVNLAKYEYERYQEHEDFDYFEDRQCVLAIMEIFGNTNWTQVFAAIGNSHSTNLPLIAS